MTASENPLRWPDAIRVQTPHDLDRVLSADRRRAARVVLALESLHTDERAAWESKINGYYRACGCGTAALALVVAFLIGGALAVWYHDLLLRHPVVVTLLGLAALLGALGLGKALGLWIARLRLRATVASLRRRLIAV